VLEKAQIITNLAICVSEKRKEKKGTENENVEKDNGLHYQSPCLTMLY
jgi:hypothetical protein